jgi:hypothetical protein
MTVEGTEPGLCLIWEGHLQQAMGSLTGIGGQLLALQSLGPQYICMAALNN